MNLSELSKPFPAKDIEWRVQSAGTKNGKTWAMVLAYVTNRAIMERLDSVVGPENWKNEYKEWIGDSVLCGLSLKIDGEWITKWDGAEQTDIEAVKGGLSGSMKRAAVQWGIGRYLYNLDATMATILEHGEHYQAAKQGKYEAFRWNAPLLPAWALPEGEKNNAKPEKPKQDIPASSTDQETKPESKPAVPADAHILAEGEVIGGWFWKLSAEQRKQYIPAGCKYSKVNGSWTVIREAA
jgi:hypothetical protein